MSQQPEMRFVCDRCASTINVSTNEQQGMTRGKAPAGWTTLWIENSTTPASHLCPTCGPLFLDFMKGQR